MKTKGAELGGRQQGMHGQLRTMSQALVETKNLIYLLAIMLNHKSFVISSVGAEWAKKGCPS